MVPGVECVVDATIASNLGKSDYRTFEYWDPFVRFALPVQTVDATLAWSLLAGVSKPKVFLGR